MLLHLSHGCSVQASSEDRIMTPVNVSICRLCLSCFCAGQSSYNCATHCDPELCRAMIVIMCQHPHRAQAVSQKRQAFMNVGRCSVQRLPEQQLLELGSNDGSMAASLGTLEVPKPDSISKCRAMIGYCQAAAVWMMSSVAIIQRLAHINNRSQASDVKKQQLSAEVTVLCSAETVGHSIFC